MSESVLKKRVVYAGDVLMKLIEVGMTPSVAAKLLASVPAVDVSPVVHGEWVHLGGDEWCCSSCGFVISTEGSWDKPGKKYCEECGAKMNLEGGKHNG